MQFLDFKISMSTLLGFVGFISIDQWAAFGTGALGCIGVLYGFYERYRNIVTRSEEHKRMMKEQDLECTRLSLEIELLKSKNDERRQIADAKTETKRKYQKRSSKLAGNESEVTTVSNSSD